MHVGEYPRPPSAASIALATDRSPGSDAPVMRARLGVLDLSFIASGEDAAAALANTLDLARHAEALGFTRYWLAEHHNAGALACSSPEVVIAAVASATRTLRVGSGGVMLPNHSPLRVAETFRVLEALYPTRIDLGVGRAAGTDKKTALALRRSEALLGSEAFGTQLDELLRFLSSDPDPLVPFNATKAAPVGVPAPELWLLGASIESARDAGKRGIAYAYAHHFAPGGAAEALDAYREAFRASRWRAVPRTIVAAAVVCGPSDAAAEELASSGALFFLRAGRGLRDLPLPSVDEAKGYTYDDDERALVAQQRTALFVGGPERVRDGLTRLLDESGADELLVTTTVHCHDQRRRSYERLAEARLG
jgi:luciferase family oxidoreductase group 1